MAKRTRDKMQDVGIGEIAQMGREDLLDVWPKLMGALVPRGMSQGMLRRFLAFEMQTKIVGRLSKGELAAIARLDARNPLAKSKRISMAPGSRFLREWNGMTHVVERTEAGYQWNGEVYTSLSAIAKAITGAHWSGPRFFGIQGPSRGSAVEIRAPK